MARRPRRADCSCGRFLYRDGKISVGRFHSSQYSGAHRRLFYRLRTNSLPRRRGAPESSCDERHHGSRASVFRHCFYFLEGGVADWPLGGILWFAAMGVSGSFIGRYLSLVGMKLLGLARSSIVTQTSLVWASLFAVVFAGEWMTWIHRGRDAGHHDGLDSSGL